MAKEASEFYKKVSSLKNLTEAIKEVKKTLPKDVKVTKALPANQPVPGSEVTIKDAPMKYLGRKKVINGILSHMIGTGNDGDNHYQMDVDLEKYNKEMPCVHVSLVSPNGEIKDQSPERYKKMKDAVSAVVLHKMKKAWNSNE